MVDQVTVADLKQTGRNYARDPSLPRVYVTHNANFSAAADLVIDFALLDQAAQFGVPRSLFIDNSSNPSEVEVSVSGTDAYFTVPSYAEGNFVINAADKSRIRFVTDGGATDMVTLTLFNYDVAPVVWYRYGAVNKDIPIMVQGAHDAGTDIDGLDFRNPVLAGGSDSDGVVRRLATDNTGRLLIVGSGAGGQVYGIDADGAPPTQPPIAIAGFDGVNIQYISTDNAGRVNVNTVAVAPPANSVITSVADSAANQLILASNVARRGGSVYNDSDQVLYLSVDNTAASPTNFTTKMQPDSYFEIPFGYTGDINGIWAANSTGSARVTEYS